MTVQQLPEGWEAATLGDVTDIQMGNSPPGTSYNQRGEGIPLINGPVEFSADALGKTIQSKFTTEPTKMCGEKDLLVCVRGATAGRTNIAAFSACIGRGVASVRAVIHQDYVNHFVINSRYELLGKGTGTTFPNISQEKLSELDIPVPPLNEQRRIVAKIEALQERSRKARAALEAIPPLLEQFRQSVLAAAFRGNLTADWRAQHPDVEPASVLLDRIRAERRRHWEEAELAKMQAKGKMPKDEKWKERYEEPEPVDETEMPELPEGWCWARWDEVGRCQNGRAFPSKEYAVQGVKLLRPGKIYTFLELFDGRKGMRGIYLIHGRMSIQTSWLEGMSWS